MSINDKIFETDNFIDVLCSNGYEKEKQTLFFCEGVKFYLSKDTVRRILCGPLQNLYVKNFQKIVFSAAVYYHTY